MHRGFPWTSLPPLSYHVLWMACGMVTINDIASIVLEDFGGFGRTKMFALLMVEVGCLSRKSWNLLQWQLCRRNLIDTHVHTKLTFDLFRHLLIPLMNAERAWGYAMQLKQQENEEPRKHYHLVKRFSKAVMWSKVRVVLLFVHPSSLLVFVWQKLRALCSARADAKTLVIPSIFLSNNVRYHLHTDQSANLRAGSQSAFQHRR